MIHTTKRVFNDEKLLILLHAILEIFCCVTLEWWTKETPRQTPNADERTMRMTSYHSRIECKGKKGRMVHLIDVHSVSADQITSILMVCNSIPSAMFQESIGSGCCGERNSTPTTSSSHRFDSTIRLFYEQHPTT
jgi:hypothetical protein